MLLYVSIILCLSNLVFAFAFYKKTLESKNLNFRLKEKADIELKNQELIRTLELKSQTLSAEINNLKVIEGEKNSLSKILSDKDREVLEKQRQIDILRNDYYLVEKKAELTLQEKEQLEKEKSEWQDEKAKLLKEISYNIIQENIKRNNELQEKGKKEIEEITKNLYSNFSGVLEKISSLNDDTKKTENELDLIKRGLLNPTGAGLTSETTLANILKASNLQEKASKDSVGDYILQTSFNTQNCEEDIKRPDGIVYLPNNNYIIIDSKSSKHFLELQKCMDEGNEEAVKETKKKIKDRMNKHLSDLKSKDYQKAQIDYLNLNNESNATIMMVMFLQTEKMLEVIREIDPEFENKCYNQNIFPLTPVGLINLLNSARYTIQKEKQNMNFDNLREELRKLFDNVGNLFVHSKNLGKSLEKSLSEYNEFANIFNKKILLRFKNMEKIGIESSKRSFSNSKLDTYQILTQSINTIDSEAEEVSSNLIEGDNI